MFNFAFLKIIWILTQIVSVQVMELGGGWGKFLEDKPHSSSILEAQKYVRQRLENKHLPLFLLSKGFQSRNTAEDISEGTDDLLATRKRRAQAVLKVIDDSEKKFYKSFNIQSGPPDYSQIDNIVFPPIKKHSLSIKPSHRWSASEGMALPSSSFVSLPRLSISPRDEEMYIIVKVSLKGQFCCTSQGVCF